MIPAGRTLSLGELFDEVTPRIVGGPSIRGLPVFVRLPDGDDEPIVGVEVYADRVVVEVERESLDHDDVIELSRMREFIIELAENKRTKAGRAALELLDELDDGSEA
ncbi:MAG: hypothetical protein A2135_10000 [Actinobacteria bacterium RBG_16_67_15]|nr:MAG: hypothetical protein A2135_10000 [Actinobacteria bacterium RBG_16_67_15]